MLEGWGAKFVTWGKVRNTHSMPLDVGRVHLRRTHKVVRVHMRTIIYHIHHMESGQKAQQSFMSNFYMRLNSFRSVDSDALKARFS